RDLEGLEDRAIRREVKAAYAIAASDEDEVRAVEENAADVEGKIDGRALGQREADHAASRVRDLVEPVAAGVEPPHAAAPDDEVNARAVDGLHSQVIGLLPIAGFDVGIENARVRVHDRSGRVHEHAHQIEASLRSIVPRVDPGNEVVLPVEGDR